MKYTGTSDGIAKGKRKGTEAFVKHVSLLSKGNLWNNGTWGVRAIKGKPEYLSVHSTGRAMDLSWRGKSRAEANKVIEMIVANADALGLMVGVISVLVKVGPNTLRLLLVVHLMVTGIT